MSALEPIYRLTVYADEAMTTALTPDSGAVHSDPFQVATAKGVSGYQPYLFLPEGRESSIDPKSRTVDTGRLTVRLLDKRTGSGNLERWVTAFAGRIAGQRVKGEESTDGGGSWSTFYTGRLHGHGLRGRASYRMVIRDTGAEARVRTFLGRPHSTISYAAIPPLLPVGLEQGWAGISAVDPLPGTMKGVGSGWPYIFVDPSALEAFQASRNLITRALRGRIVGPVPTVEGDPGGWILDRAHPDLRVKLTISSGARSGETGHLALGRTVMTRDGIGYIEERRQEVAEEVVRYAAATVGVLELDSSDPDHIALPSNDETVEFRVIGGGRPSEDLPLLIQDVHPVKLWRDVLDGKFGVLETDGSVRDSILRDETAAGTLPDYQGFSNLIADDSMGLFRGKITEPMPVDEFQEVLCRSYNLGYRRGADGRIVPFRMDPPGSASGLTVIGNSALVESTEPESDVDREAAITKVEWTHYADEVRTVDDLEKAEGPYPEITPSQVVSHDMKFVVLDLGDPSLGVKEQEIDAVGIRDLVSGDEQLDGLARREWNRRFMQGVSEELDKPFGKGTRVHRLTLRRVSGVEDCVVGDRRVLDVDEIPDPATNKRGGARVVQCIGRAVRGGHVDLTFLDLGESAQADPPSLADPTLVVGEESYTVDQDVTVNAAGDPVEVWIAVTDTSVTTRPASDDRRWRFGGKRGSSGTVRVRGIPAGKRVWTRGRSIPPDGIPSGWAYPTTEYVDTVSGPTPSSLAVSGITGSRATVTWTNGDSTLPVRVRVRDDTAGTELLRRVLPAGAVEYVVRGTTNGNNYTAYLAHRDREGSFGAEASVSWTAGASNDRAPRMHGIGILYGKPGDAGDQDESEASGVAVQTGIAVYLIPGDPALPVKLETAPDDGAGSPDTANSEVFEVPPGRSVYVDERDLGSGERWYRAWHIEEGHDPGESTGWHLGAPTVLPDKFRAVPGAPLVAVDLQVDGSGGVDLVFDGEPRVGSFRWAVSKTGFPDASSGTVQATDAEGNATVTGITTLAVSETAYVHVLAYESEDGSGGYVASVKVSEGRSANTQVAGRLRSSVSSAGVADLFLAVEGASSVFPVSAAVYQDDPTSAAMVTHTFNSAGEIGPADYAALNDISLPPKQSKQWWAKLTDAFGNVAWAFTMADRNSVPGGAVTADDYKSTPALVCKYDEDVEKIVVTTPDGKTKTWSGLSGGGKKTYTVGVTALDDASTESEMGFGVSRSPYVVDYSAGGRSVELYDGPLHGSSVPPGFDYADHSVWDTGTDDEYEVGWSLTDSVPDDGTYSVEIVFYRENIRVGSASGIDAYNDDPNVSREFGDGVFEWIDSNAGDGNSNLHHVVLKLYNASGVVATAETREFASLL